MEIRACVKENVCADAQSWVGSCDVFGGWLSAKLDNLMLLPRPVRSSALNSVLRRCVDVLRESGHVLRPAGEWLSHMSATQRYVYGYRT
jgi:hypothetical protein